MQGHGFEDGKQAAYGSSDRSDLAGQFRRFSESGPAYEVLRIVDRETAWIRVVYSGEELAYPIADLLQDPTAMTVP